MGSKRLLHNILLCVVLILSCLTLYSCSETKTVVTDLATAKPGEPQYIHYIMEPASLGGHSIADYTKILKAGDAVSGYMMVTGLWEVEGDYTTPWTFEAWDPDSVLLDTATINNWYEDPYYAFKFIANAEGEYTIRAIHISLYTRDLVIMISPAGWQLKETTAG